MATTIDPEGDPTYLAFQRAKQYGDMTYQRDFNLQQQKANTDVQRGANDLAREQTQSLDTNLQGFRNRGFGQSGLRTQQEDRIRADIASRLGALLGNYQYQSNVSSNSLLDQLANSAFQDQEQQLQARSRLTQDNANSGVGI